MKKSRLKKFFENKKDSRKDKSTFVSKGDKVAGDLTDNQSNENNKKNNLNLEENNTKNNMTEPNNNQNLTESEKLNITTENIDTRRGSANIGNTTGDNPDLSYRTNSGSGVMFAGPVHGGSGPSVFGQNTGNNTQNNTTNTSSESKLQQLVNKAKREIDKLNGADKDKKKELRGALHSIRDNIRKNVNNWQSDFDLEEKIDSLGGKLENIELIQEICQAQAEEAKLEVRKAQVEQQTSKNK